MADTQSLVEEIEHCVLMDASEKLLECLLKCGIDPDLAEGLIDESCDQLTKRQELFTSIQNMENAITAQNLQESLVRLFLGSDINFGRIVLMYSYVLFLLENNIFEEDLILETVRKVTEVNVEPWINQPPKPKLSINEVIGTLSKTVKIASLTLAMALLVNKIKSKVV